jgi:hypothetical protein
MRCLLTLRYCERIHPFWPRPRFRGSQSLASSCGKRPRCVSSHASHHLRSGPSPPFTQALSRRMLATSPHNSELSANASATGGHSPWVASVRCENVTLVHSPVSAWPAFGPGSWTDSGEVGTHHSASPLIIRPPVRMGKLCSPQNTHYGSFGFRGCAMAITPRWSSEFGHGGRDRATGSRLLGGAGTMVDRQLSNLSDIEDSWTGI